MHGRICVFTICFAALLFSSLAAPLATAAPVVVWYSVTNDDTILGRVAQVLDLTFNQRINTGGGMLNPAIGAKSATFSTPTTCKCSVLAGSGGQGISFGPDGGIQAGKSDIGVLQLVGPSVAVSALSGEFSYPVGDNRPIPVKNITVTVGKRDDGEIDITNNESSTIFFSGVLASTDLSSSLFVDTSSSALDAQIANQLFATGMVPDFSLASGQTKTLTLGPVIGDNYTAVVFTADVTATPSPSAVRLGFAGNTELPEPGSFYLPAVALGLLAAYRRRVPLN
jgi:hypothetical protein